MMTSVGQVQAIQSHRALVSYQRRSSCQGCEQRTQCATGQIQQALPESDHQIWVDLPGHTVLQVGDWVELTLPESDFLKLSFTLYGVPMLGLIFGVLLSVWWQTSEAMSALLGVGGLTLGLIWVRYFRVKDQNQTTGLRYVRRLGTPICGDFVTNPPLKDSE